MKLIIDILEERISAAMVAVAGVEDCDAIVRPSTDPKFGDYQANGVMALAKKAKTNPRKLAEEVVEKLDLSEIYEPPEVAGPGFINLRLKADFLADRLLEINKDPAALAVQKAEEPKTIVVDFSSPNIAKQMHVGHLRSTIIGDAICRMLEFLGHKVIKQNHIGDWGTQFGMLVWNIIMQKQDDPGVGMLIQQLFEQASFVLEDEESIRSIEEAVRSFHISDLEVFYRDAKQEFDADPVFQRQAKKRVVELHNASNWLTLEIWRHIVDESRRHYQPIYDQLGVNLSKADERGESTYNDSMPKVVEDLEKGGFAEESDGAICVFPEGFKNKEGQPLPFIIRKSDGAYLYATTDLAAVRYRVDELKADAIVYVTDSRQKMHFEMLFAVARMAGWASENIELSHVMFGSILGDDGTPLKTRSGESVKLKELLDEAVERAKTVVEEKNPELPAEKKGEIAAAVGIGAVKYADYSNNRTSDYVFSFDKMLAMEGNTAPYMQYAYARIKSIERKAESKEVDIETELADIEDLSLTEPAELDLAKYLIRYGEAIASAAGDYRPNYLTTYLYELAQKFSTFYTNCPVLKAEAEKRPTRLLLCDLTARTIRHGLTELLGINVVEQM
ncbi:MAG: arginine--tRNA ligase [Planctomycetota bacterium]|jgi:arginyl-tRNA synthetase